jgi:hypothetical protein
MRRRLLLGALLISAVGCAADVSANKGAGAATAVGFGVGAAAIHRAATGGCWADCRPGLVCDRGSGTCIPYEPSSSLTATRPVASSAAETSIADDPCKGLCLRGERCRVTSGIADCVRDGPGRIGP